MSAELPDGTRVVVTRGNPKDDELAAVLVALTKVTTADTRPRKRSKWVETARYEGVGLEPDP